MHDFSAFIKARARATIDKYSVMVAGSCVLLLDGRGGTADAGGECRIVSGTRISGRIAGRTRNVSQDEGAPGCESQSAA